MRSMRRHRTAAVVLTTIFAGAVVTVPLTATGKPTRSQEFFQKALLDDDSTTSSVKRLLRGGGGFVSPDVLFADVTGDGRSDAIVLVENGGVAGAVALYVFSTDGKGENTPLRVVYRSQRLYRAAMRLTGASLILNTPRYREGDDVCCPDRIVQRTYLWSPGARTLQLDDSQEIVPAATAPATAPTVGR